MSSDYAQAFACGLKNWSGFWGDPLFSGTLMVAAYATAALMSLRAVRDLQGAERAVWALAVVLMGFQVLNTPMDLHGLAWASGRCLAHIQGWYAERHVYQRELLVLLAIMSAAIFGAGLLVLRRDLLTNGLLILGLCLSLGMTVVKGVNYHRLEVLYQFPLGPLREPDLVEIWAIACVLLATHLKRRSIKSV